MKLTPFVLSAAIFLAGCEKEATLHSGLEERQANLVMAALLPQDAGRGRHVERDGLRVEVRGGGQPA